MTTEFMRGFGQSRCGVAPEEAGTSTGSGAPATGEASSGGGGSEACVCCERVEMIGLGAYVA
jgi:hypothetical protein